MGRGEAGGGVGVQRAGGGGGRGAPGEGGGVGRGAGGGGRGGGGGPPAANGEVDAAEDLLDVVTLADGDVQVADLQDAADGQAGGARCRGGAGHGCSRSSVAGRGEGGIDVHENVVTLHPDRVDGDRLGGREVGGFAGAQV